MAPIIAWGFGRRGRSVSAILAATLVPFQKKAKTLTCLKKHLLPDSQCHLCSLGLHTSCCRMVSGTCTWHGASWRCWSTPWDRRIDCMRVYLHVYVPIYIYIHLRLRAQIFRGEHVCASVWYVGAPIKTPDGRKETHVCFLISAYCMHMCISLHIHKLGREKGT